jgi:hypothetical protein
LGSSQFGVGDSRMGTERVRSSNPEPRTANPFT